MVSGETYMNNTVVIGIGNILMQDDGIGVHIISLLKSNSISSNIELIDGGTSTLDMLCYFTDYKKVVVIDSLKAGYLPGTIYKITPNDIMSYRKENLSIHDVQILDVVKIANLMGYYPEVTIIGVEPLSMDYGLELSDEIKKIIPELINQVKIEISK